MRNVVAVLGLGLAMVVGAAVAQTPAAQPSASQENAAGSALNAQTPEGRKFLEYQTRLSQMEMRQEEMRREMELMRLQMEYQTLRRQTQAFDGSEMPTVVAIYSAPERSTALLKGALGQMFFVSVGDAVGDGGYVVDSVDPKDGVWVVDTKVRSKASAKVQPKRIRLQSALVSVAAGQSPLPGQVPGAVGAPVPVMSSLPLPVPPVPVPPSPMPSAPIPPLRGSAGAPMR